MYSPANNCCPNSIALRIGLSNRIKRSTSHIYVLSKFHQPVVLRMLKEFILQVQHNEFEPTWLVWLIVTTNKCLSNSWKLYDLLRQKVRQGQCSLECPISSSVKFCFRRSLDFIERKSRKPDCQFQSKVVYKMFWTQNIFGACDVVNNQTDKFGQFVVWPQKPNI